MDVHKPVGGKAMARKKKKRRGRKPVFDDAQQSRIEKISLATVRRETTSKGKPDLTRKQARAVRRIVADTVETVLSQIGAISANGDH
ncbi:hypothetical protein LCGC14_0163040 [marine sediment metagenome]|uniref:Uncharacterized protein n=1 Tax=marine sediment metagenome TaxID=412755 RepID=A0A0F9UUA4_9ZZZZ